MWKNDSTEIDIGPLVYDLKGTNLKLAEGDETADSFTITMPRKVINTM